MIGALVRSAGARIAARGAEGSGSAVRAAICAAPGPVTGAVRGVLAFGRPAVGLEHRTGRTSGPAAIGWSAALHAQAGGAPGGVEFARRLASCGAAGLADRPARDRGPASAPCASIRRAAGLMALAAGDAGGLALGRSRLASVLEARRPGLGVAGAVGRAPLRRAGLACPAIRRDRIAPALAAQPGLAATRGLPARALALIGFRTVGIAPGLSSRTETRIARPSGSPALLRADIADRTVWPRGTLPALRTQAGSQPLRNPAMVTLTVLLLLHLGVSIRHGALLSCSGPERWTPRPAAGRPDVRRRAQVSPAGGGRRISRDSASPTAARRSCEA